MSNQEPIVQTTHYLQTILEREIHKLKAPRLGSVVLDVALCHPTADFPTTFSKANICHLLNQQNQLKTNAIVYLDPKYLIPPSYPATESEFSQDKQELPLAHLLRQLQVAAITGGDKIASNGRHKPNKTGDPCHLRLRCQCFRQYTGSKVDKSTCELVIRDDYRQSTIRNDRKNNRHGKEGRRGSQKTNTQRPLLTEDVCPFSLMVYSNSHGYYLKGGMPYHVGHAIRDNLRMPCNLICKQEQTLIRDMYNGAHASSGIALRTAFIRSSRCNTPTLFSKSQIKYLCYKKSGSKQSEGAEIENSEWDNIFEHLENIGGSYVSLLQRVEHVADSNTGCTPPVRRGVLFNETFIESTVSKKDHPIVTAEDAVAEKSADNHRRVRSISDDQEMVVGLAFTTPSEVRQFRLFHTVLHIDATADTNKEGRPLVTVSSKDSTGKMFIVLRAFLPNEQSWAYNWLFTVVFPALLGSKVLEDVTMFLTDGDNQEIIQLEQAIKENFGDNIYRARCSWHIIDRGWLRHVKVPLGGFSRRKRPAESFNKKRKKPKSLTSANKLARKVYRWMFSWAQPGFCLTADEYQVSKALFIAFVMSEAVQDILPDDFGSTVINFLRSHVKSHEQRMCYYVKHSLFHLETHSNTSHEGTNNALKHGSAPVMPQNTMDRAVVTLTDNAQIKVQDTLIQLWDKTGSTKLWSNSPTASSVTDLCESMLVTEWKKSADYFAFRAGEYRWLVVYKDDREMSKNEDSFWDWDDEDENVSDNDDDIDKKEKLVAAAKEFGIIPRFKRVYEVIRNPSTQCLDCITCCNQKRMGFPCCHVASVIKSDSQLSNIYNGGFPLSSVRVFWRQEYYIYGMSTNDEYESIRKAIFQLAAKDTHGVHCPTLRSEENYNGVPEHILKILHAPASARVLNYTDSQVISAMQPGKDRKNPGLIQGDSIPGLSQTSHFGDEFGYNDDDSNDDADIFGNDREQFDGMIASERDSSYNPTIRDILIKEFEDMVEAIQNSDEPTEILKRVRESIHTFTEEARGNSVANVFTVGKRASMLPSSSKRQKTHGTKHMNLR